MIAPSLALIVFMGGLAAGAAGADPLEPPPGKVRWGSELPSIGELMMMSPPELEAALKEAVALDVTVSRRTALQALILRALAAKQESAAAVIDVFPLAIDVKAEQQVGDPKVNAVAAARLAEMAVVAFRDVAFEARATNAAVDGARLLVSVAVLENDKRGLDMGPMRSFGIQLTASLVDGEGRERLSFGVVRSALGSDPRAAIRHDFDRNAAAGVVPEVIELLARQVLRSADVSVPPIKRRGFTVYETPAAARDLAATLDGLTPTELRTELAATLRPRVGASFETTRALAALRALAKTDDRARQALAFFPAELVVDGPGLSPMIVAAFAGQLKRVAQEADLSIVARGNAPDGARIRVTLRMTETSSDSPLASYATTSHGTLRAPDGTMLTFSRTSQSLGINAGFAANDGSWGSKVGAHTFDELVRAVVSFGAGIFLVDDMPPQQIDEIRAAVAALDAGLQAGRGLSGFAAPEGARPSLRISAVVETPAGISPLLTEALTPTIERALAAAGFVLTIDDSDSAALTLSAVASEPKSLTLLGEGLKVVDVTATWTLRQETGSAIVAQGACKAMSVGDTSEIVLRLKGQVAACLASLLATGLVAELH